MEHPRGASAIDTIERPVLPPLPPAIHAVRNPGVHSAPAPPVPDVVDEVPIVHEDVEVFTPPEALAPPEPNPTVIEEQPEAAPQVVDPVAEVVIEGGEVIDAVAAQPEAASSITSRLRRTKNATKETSTPIDESGSSGIELTNKKLLIALFSVFAVVFVMAGVRLTGVLTNSSLVTSLEEGDCIEDFFTPNQGEFREVFVVGTTDCANPHAYEVYAVGESVYTESAYPGIDGVFAVAQSYCDEQYVSFVGGDFLSSPWNVWTFAPTEDRWNAGERNVQCIVGDFDQTELTTGSLRNAGR